MIVPTHAFREYDVRGIADRDLTDAVAKGIGESDPAWGLVRASNTGPILVMRFEATSARRRDEMRAEVDQVVSKALARLVAR